RRGARLCSICSGVFVLAAAGVLDGLAVTTHWRYVERLRARHPSLQVNPDALYVDQGAIVTSAGSAAAEAPARQALADFYQRFEKEALVIDKWFSMQATRRGTAEHPTLDTVRELLAHPAFNLKNPNRARSLIFGFCAANPAQFHAADGSGYAFWADQVLALDALNPQVAARLARSLENWRRFTPALRERMREALARVAAGVKSRDVREIVEKALA
ncbi:aminopeptidase N C-terminal domain-containing protein, partial [Burkholderia sp. Cy-647]|uniref:aminopeptidase N C-terminal domain-containing protein n=1 Tax=Burkholderia sp. Cy-647 TaxID=2608328 RepID=UPI00141DE779